MPTLYSETFGTGKPIILVHGWAMHSGIWRGFAQQLARHYQVTCIDLPSHGRSRDAINRVSTPFTLENVSNALVNALPDKPCCWLGWSLGATIVLDIAQRYPERVNSLILLAGNPLFVSTEQWAGVNSTVLDAFAANLTMNCQATLLRFLALQVNGLPDGNALLKDLKTAIMEYPSPDNDSLQGGLNILKHTDLRAVLAQLTIPVSVILGDKDTLVPVAVGQQMQQLLAQLELTILEGAGHIAFLSHTEQLLTLICHFMDKPCL